MAARHLVLVLSSLLAAACAGQSPEPTAWAETMQQIERQLEAGKPETAAKLLADRLREHPDDFASWRAYIKSTMATTGQTPPTPCPPDIARYWQVYRQPLTQRENALRELVAGYPQWRPWLCLDLAQIKLQQRQYRAGAVYVETAMSALTNCAEVHMTAARLALQQAKWQQSLASAREAARCNPYLLHPYFFEAAQELIAGNYSQSMAWLRQAQLLMPDYRFNADERFGYFTACHREISSLVEQRLWQSALQTADEALAVFPEHAGFLADKGRILSALDQPELAAALLARANALDPYRIRTIQAYRPLLLAKGRYRDTFALWRKAVPETIWRHPENLLRSKYERLEAAFDKASDKDPASLLELARAMAQAGWEEDAAVVYRQIDGPLVDGERRQLHRHLQFVYGVRRLLYAHYQQSGGNIVDILRQIRRLAKEWQIPLRTWPSREFDSYFVVAREVDPFDPQPGSVAHYLAGYNKFLDFGNNYGYVEGRVLNGVSLRRHVTTVWGKPFAYRVMVGDETTIETYLGYHSGGSRIAGRAFLSGKGFYIALDTLRPNIYSLQNLYRRLNEPAAIELPAAATDVFPYLAGVADAWLRRSFADVLPALEKPETRWQVLYEQTLQRQLDTVHHHELGHLVDFTCFLPVYANLGNIADMVWQQRLSPQRIHTRFETTAEMFGLAHAQDVCYYLYQEMERLDIENDGIFGMVYWAWYGKMPGEDPYYLTACRIFRDLLVLQYGSDDWRQLATLATLPAQQITDYARRLCQQHQIARRCD